MRAFEIDLHERLRAERAYKDIAGNAGQTVRVHMLAARHFPDEAVVEAHLFNDALANPVSPAVADMADPRALGPQQQRGRGGAHAAEFRVLLPLGVDTGIG